MKDNNKKTVILSVIAVVTLALLVVGATYAYFTAQGGNATSTNLNVTTYTTDVFTFATGDEINLKITQSDFASGKGNAVGSTFASATLTANNKTNTATEHYYVYLNIENNDFEYTINNTTPELMLTITDSEENEITDIEGLTHTTVTDGKGTTISGYDITTKSGLLTIFKNREITTTSKKEEKWNITITFVNYDASQNANAGKSMSAKVMIQKEVIPQVISDVCANGENLATCITTLANKSTSSLTNIYYHDSSLTNGAGDNSYRYAGASESVNNFVCFGTNESTCPTDNLYRIIGVFEDQVKLIKYDYANSNLLGTDGDYSTDTYSKSSYSTYKGELTTINRYYWNYKNDTNIKYGSNDWSTSLLNKTNLNTNYLNNIGTDWSDLIEDTTWKVSGHTTSSVTPSTMYTAEITNATKTYGPSDGTSKIGLMYASDYGFAAEPSAWTIKLFSYYSPSITSVNWMYMGMNEWIMLPDSSDSSSVFRLYNHSGLYTGGNANNGNCARPVLYLKASVAYAGGSGTKDSPIILVV